MHLKVGKIIFELKFYFFSEGKKNSEQTPIKSFH